VSHELRRGADSHPVDVWIGKRIRTLREARGMSQESLAERIGVSYHQLQKYEKGENRVYGSRLAEIATALKCGVIKFFPPDNNVRLPERDIYRYADNYETLRIIRTFGDITSATVRAALLALVESLAKDL
jgi:transcriptional regulator with XRE-family HTH domain